MRTIRFLTLLWLNMILLTAASVAPGQEALSKVFNEPMQSIEVQCADVKEVADTLNKTIGNEMFVGNQSAQCIYFFGSAEMAAEIGDIVAKIDDRAQDLKDEKAEIAKREAQELEGKTSSEVDEQLKIFQLQHGSANEALDVLSSLNLTDEVKMAARGNDLVVRGAPQAVEVIEAILLRLDTQGYARRAATSVTASDDPFAAPTPAGATTTTTTTDRDWEAEIAKSKNIYADLEKSIDTLAAQARQLSSTAGSGSLGQANELKQLVTAAYAARRELQLAKIGLQRQRLDQLEQRVKARDAIANRVIQRRVTELLKGESPETPDPDADVDPLDAIERR
ncbi:MAG: hypothetical protein R3E01_00555 [Pirellulaceae bacterium]|nr:hypothetical protein [Planctomycetales bacterium]